jgi:hypothetical protein
MARYPRLFGSAIGVLLLASVLIGCESMQPYRTEAASADQQRPLCNPSPNGEVPEQCRRRMHEHSTDYDLFFAEFTDQGLQYPREAQYGNAGFQLTNTIEGLYRIAANAPHRGVSVFVYVHGWKHNAMHDDSDVRSFRTLLQAADSLERAQGSNYRVVGIYVGWRGLSVRGEPASNISFWSRKAAALRVAQGSPRELFNRLRTFKCAQNRIVARAPEHVADLGGCTDPAAGLGEPKVRMMMIGHSFGAHILYNAVAGSLVESLSYEPDTGDPNATNPRFADMIVLLNPAFEASFYAPLHHVATASEFRRYQAPILVSVTTTEDWATGRAFPIGRWVNSILERSASREESDAIIRTMGHMPNYITHTLTASGTRPSICGGWQPLWNFSNPDARWQQARINFDGEKANTEHFPGTRGAPLPHGWTRTFCGGARLQHRSHDPNSIIWNVSTDASIMTGHNDITNPILVDFIRQLYRDTILYPRPAGPNITSRGQSSSIQTR